MVIITELVDGTRGKLHLGGWRHKVSNVKYFNATTQTPPRVPRVPWENMCSREVQVAEIKDEGTQSLRNRGTQMWRHDCCVSNETDEYVTANPYESCEEKAKRLDFDGKARIIQKNYKVYRFFKFIKLCADKYRCAREEYMKRQKEKELMNRRRMERLIFRKVWPRTASDFDLLYSLIDRWRLDCLENFRSRCFSAGQRAENYCVLEKTVEMFNVIDRLRKVAWDRFARKKRARFLSENCKPVRWIGRTGKPLEMITLKTQNSRRLKSIYDALDNANLTTESRVEILMMLKQNLQRHRCKSAIRLEELLNQELMLLPRRIKNRSFDCLKKRTASFFLYFLSPAGACTCDNVDDGTSDVLRPEELREPLEERTSLCGICKKILPYRKFSARNRTRGRACCDGCATLRQRNVKQISYDSYIFMLNRVRAEELQRNSLSKLPFLMRGTDMYFLVNTLWHGCSIISKYRDIFRLRMVRFYVDVEWAPWNCILLTEEEAEIHLGIEDLSSIYTKSLMAKIYLRHLTAKNRFQDLMKLQNNYRQSSFT